MSDQEIWHDKMNYVRSLINLPEDWDDHGAEAISQEIIDTTISLMELMKNENKNPPNAIHPLMDNNVMLEWEHEGTFWRLEIEKVGEGEMMITYPDHNKRPTFEDWKWNGQHLDLPGM